MEYQGKRRSQIFDSESFVFMGIITSIAVLILLVIYSRLNAPPVQEKSKRCIKIDSKNIEIVNDEYGNEYLKQYTCGKQVLYIPYLGQTFQELVNLEKIRFKEIKQQNQ